MVGDELLSAFKVATFSAFDEDKEASPIDVNTEDESKDWVGVIMKLLFCYLYLLYFFLYKKRTILFLKI